MNVGYDFDEDPEFPYQPNGDNFPGTNQIAGYVRSMLPTRDTFLQSVDRFAACRKGGAGYTIDIGLEGAVTGTPYMLVEMYCERDDEDDMEGLSGNTEDGSRDRRAVQPSAQLTTGGVPERADYDYVISDDAIEKLAKYLTYEP
jgi:hypothetical protein